MFSLSPIPTFAGTLNKTVTSPYCPSLLTGIVFLLSLCHTCVGQLQYPIDVAVSGDEIFVVDRKLPGLQKIRADGTLEVVFAASKKYRTPLNAARCVVVGPAGEVIVGDSATRQLYRMEQGKPVPILTNEIGIGIPYAMVFDKSGNLFVADLEPPGRIFRIPAGKTVPEEFAVQPGVRGLAVDSKGNLIALTGHEDAILRFTPDGKKSVVLGNRPFRFPNSLAIRGEEMYVCDSYGQCIWKVDSAGKASRFCSKGLTYPGGIAVRGKKLLVTDAKTGKIFEIAEDGTASAVPIKTGN